jgi:hypothetical protein
LIIILTSIDNGQLWSYKQEESPNLKRFTLLDEKGIKVHNVYNAPTGYTISFETDAGIYYIDGDDISKLDIFDAYQMQMFNSNESGCGGITSKDLL